MIKTLTALSALCVLALTTTLSVPLASCTKEIIVRDTITLKDTVTIKDTVTVIDSSNCYSCYDLKEGLVAYYNFNNGTLNDSSGNDNHIVFNNAVKTKDRLGRDNNAYLFNGASSYMRVSNSASLNPEKITLAAFVKISDFYTGNCDGNSILTKGVVDASAGFYTLRFHDINYECSITPDFSKIFFAGGKGTTYLGADTSFIQKNQWYHVVYTYDGEDNNIYVNGELKATRKLSVASSTNSLDLFIGKNNSSVFPYWFNGIMDDIKIYNRALCLGEVKALYNSKK